MAKKQAPEIIDVSGQEAQGGQKVEPLQASEKLYATRIEFGLGSSLLGQALTMSAAKGSILEVTEMGIMATSKEGRVVLVPWSNVRCCELKGKPKALKK